MCNVKMISIPAFGESAVPIFVYIHVTDPGPYVKNLTAFFFFSPLTIGV